MFLIRHFHDEILNKYSFLNYIDILKEVRFRSFNEKNFLLESYIHYFDGCTNIICYIYNIIFFYFNKIKNIVKTIEIILTTYIQYVIDILSNTGRKTTFNKVKKDLSQNTTKNCYHYLRFFKIPYKASSDKDRLISEMIINYS